MWLCGLLVDRLSAYMPDFRWLNPGIIWKKKDPHEKNDIYLWKKSTGRYTTAAVTYCGLVHRLSANNPGGLRWFESGCHRKKMILMKNRYLFVKKKMVAMWLCGQVDCPLISLVFVGWIQVSSGNKNDPLKKTDTCVYFTWKLKNVSCEYDRLNGWNSTLQPAW